MISSTTFSIAPSVGHLLHAAPLDDLGRIALGLLGDDHLQQILGALGRNRARRHEIDDAGDLRRLDVGLERRLSPWLLA